MKRFSELKSPELLKQCKEMVPARIKTIRKYYGLKQADFATVLNISYHTYKNWEIGHRVPCTSAVALLTLAEKKPQTFLKKQKKYIKNSDIKIPQF